MPKILPIPAEVPYSGEVSLHVAVYKLLRPDASEIEVRNLLFKTEGLPSNAAPHMLKRLGWIGIDQQDVNVTFTIQPPEELSFVTESEMRDRNPDRRVWATLQAAVTEYTQQSGLKIDGTERIVGDFGFGLEWLKLNHTNITGTGIAHHILLERANRLHIAIPR